MWTESLNTDHIPESLTTFKKFSSKNHECVVHHLKSFVIVSLLCELLPCPAESFFHSFVPCPARVMLELCSLSNECVQWFRWEISMLKHQRKQGFVVGGELHSSKSICMPILHLKKSISCIFSVDNQFCCTILDGKPTCFLCKIDSFVTYISCRIDLTPF